MESEIEVEANVQIPEPSIVKNADSDALESEGEPRATDTPAKPSPNEQVYLIEGNGQRLPFVCSLIWDRTMRWLSPIKKWAQQDTTRQCSNIKTRF